MGRDMLALRCHADVTPAQLLGDTLVNTTVAILAYHYLADFKYTEVGSSPQCRPLPSWASQASAPGSCMPSLPVAVGKAYISAVRAARPCGL